jgi:hypothetical protein
MSHHLITHDKIANILWDASFSSSLSLPNGEVRMSVPRRTTQTREPRSECGGAAEDPRFPKPEVRP